MATPKQDYKIQINRNTFENRRSGMIATKVVHTEIVQEKSMQAMRRKAMDIANEHVDFTPEMKRRNWFEHSDTYMTRSIDHIVGVNTLTYYIEVRLHDPNKEDNDATSRWR